MSQYADSVKALLGPVTLPPIEAEVGVVAATKGGVSPLLAEQLERAALAASREAFAAADKRMGLVGCAPAAANDACARNFLTAFGRRAWRRKLTTAELDRLLGLAAKAGTALASPWRGLELAVAAVLQSPHFLYRVELGEDDPSGGLRYSGYEMATRLAYLFWNSGPDDALLDAAEKGTLTTTQGLTAEVERLLAHPRTRGGVQRFFSDWLELEGLPAIEKDRTAFPAMTNTLGASMRTEILTVAEDLVFGRKADARELFLGRGTFVNAELARVYGLPAPAKTGFQPAEWTGPRRGVLGFAGILALHAKPRKTFPTGRGVFVRQALLCQVIPPPPPNVNTMLEAPPAGVKLTTRQLLQRHQADPGCAGCHALLDPIGVALENFDALGAYRAQEDGVTIDPSGTLDGTAFADAAGLSEALAAHPASMGCLVRQLHRFATGHVETAGEAPAIAALEAQLRASGNKIEALLKAVALSDSFRRAGRP